MKKYLLTALLMTVITIPHALAGQKSSVRGGVCVRSNFKDASSLFTCEHLGEVTISQIYEKGWRIISSHTEHWRTYNDTVLIIEEQR